MDFQHFDDIEDSTRDLQWRRSSRCGTGACVDVARDGDKILVRDRKFGAVSNTLTFSVNEWLQVLEAIRHGKDHPDIRVADGGVWFGGDGSGDYDLFFNSAEWRAFEEGVLLWEFEPDRLSSPAPASEGEQVADEVGPIADGSDLAATGADKEGSVSGGTAPVAAQPWDPTSPQHAVIRAAIAWRGTLELIGKQHPVDAVMAASDAAAALIQAVDALPHIDESAPVAAPLGFEHCTITGPLSDRWPTGAPLCHKGCGYPVWRHVAAPVAVAKPVEPEPAWGSGPLVDHNPFAGGTP